ncbi:hypothetical protein V5O48_015820 [Marasmius crinis-equi]|uniref:Uncharacterized protein n=1 Tax=Marasmius crinis-equi TaxID=585013 RepID=A0ABR3ETH1_9AGAR
MLLAPDDPSLDPVARRTSLRFIFGRMPNLRYECSRCKLEYHRMTPFGEPFACPHCSQNDKPPLEVPPPARTMSPLTPPPPTPPPSRSMSPLTPPPQSPPPLPRRKRKTQLVPPFTTAVELFIKSRLYTVYWPFLWNDRCVAGINHMEQRVDYMHPTSVLFSVGDGEEDARRRYVRKELIRKILYREAAKGSGHRGRVGDLLFLDRFAKPFTQEEYDAAGSERSNCFTDPGPWLGRREGMARLEEEAPDEHQRFIDEAKARDEYPDLRDWDPRPAVNVPEGLVELFLED